LQESFPLPGLKQPEPIFVLKDEAKYEVKEIGTSKIHVLFDIGRPEVIQDFQLIKNSL
jgi:hypothetical protein